jgi:outer membrane protein assembly factor BamB
MKRITLLTAALLATGLVTHAQDWPQWGGNDQGRNMYSPAKNLPNSFDPGKLKSGTEDIDPATTKNVRWTAKLGSQSYGNPVVANGKVYVGTNNESPRNRKHTGDRSILMCFDEKSGELLWQLVVPKLASGKVNDWENLGLLCAPTVEGNRVYIVTSRCEVMCLDADGLKNGNDGDFKDEAQYIVGPGKAKEELTPMDADIIWKYDMMDELGVFPHNASNCSVLITDDMLFACTSNGQDWTHVNIPSPNSPSFIALNKNTGKLIAEDDAGIGPRIYHGQWSSPSLGVVNGVKQVYFGGGDGWIYAFGTKPVKKDDVELLPTIWKVDCNPPEYKKPGAQYKYPAAEGPSEINGTPVFYKGRVYIATGQDPEHGEGVGHMVCIDPTGTGDVTKTKVLWSYKGIHRTISTASIDPDTGLLFIGDFSGFVHCLDVETGKLNWIYDMKAHMWGSTFVADGKVYVGDEDGDFVILPVKKNFDPKKDKPIFETNLGAPVYSTPIWANGVLYVASQTHLFAVGGSAVTTDQPQKLEIKKP